MAPATRTSDPYEGRFNHILRIWLRHDRFIVGALKEKNITDYLQLVRLLESPDEINALKNWMGKDDEEAMDIETSERLRYCLSLINDLQLQFGPILEDELVDISTTSRDEFDQYCAGRPSFAVYSEALAGAAKHDRIIKQAQVDTARINAAIAQAQLDRLSANTSGTAPVTSSANPGSNPGATQPSANPAHLALATLQRGVKLDQSNFPQLKTDAGWFEFHRKFGMHCDLHGLGNVLDESFVPADAPAQDLYDYQNKYLMVVMTSCIQTVKGKEIVANHSATKDARAALIELNAYYTGTASIKRKSRAALLLAKLQTPLPADLRCVSLSSAIGEWETWLTEHDALKGITTTGDAKLEQFNQFIVNVKPLGSIQTMQSLVAALIPAGSANPVSPDATILLYKQQAETLDEQLKKASLTKRSRIVNQCVWFLQLFYVMVQ